MRLWCIWCRQFVREGTLCTVLPAGTLWPWGAALCVVCCPHEVHGIPLGERPGTARRDP